MNKEEFLSKRDAIDLKLKELNGEKEQMEKEYIESNVKYPIGSKVCITLMNQNDMPMSRIIGLIFLTILNHCLTR